jgi:hypothetical protein
MVVFPTRAVPLKDDSADTRSGWLYSITPFLFLVPRGYCSTLSIFSISNIEGH